MVRLILAIVLLLTSAAQATAECGAYMPPWIKAAAAAETVIQGEIVAIKTLPQTVPAWFPEFDTRYKQPATLVRFRTIKTYVGRTQSEWDILWRGALPEPTEYNKRFRVVVGRQVIAAFVPAQWALGRPGGGEWQRYSFKDKLQGIVIKPVQYRGKVLDEFPGYACLHSPFVFPADPETEAELLVALKARS